MCNPQSTLSGETIRVEEPNLTDKFRTCQERVNDERVKRKQICGYDTYLVVVGYDGSRKQLCKMHARDEWIEQYESE